MYDEPTAGLDPVASTVVEDLMRSMHDSEELNKNGSSRRSGITSYIVVTHQHSTIRRAVDRLIFLHEVSRRLALQCIMQKGSWGCCMWLRWAATVSEMLRLTVLTNVAAPRIPGVCV